MSPFARACLLFAILGMASLYMGYRLLNDQRLDLINSFFRAEQNKVLFVGDVMLARSVETRIKQVGTDAFFKAVRPLHEQAQFVIGNFEAVIPLVHQPTPNFTFQFSVDKVFAPMLEKAGFTHFSLANNHANDFGNEAREHTDDVLWDAGLIPFGSPSEVGTSSIAYITIEDTEIALIGIQTVISTPTFEELEATIETARSGSDVQIVVVHWGDEYQPFHNTREEEFAKQLVSLGVDAIVGHHPHIIQDIGLIDDVPVFYSLGNYVFDQYFDQEVETGLALLLEINEGSLFFELVPVMSDRSVPRVANSDERKTILRSIAERSPENLRTDIVRGKIEASY